MAPGWILVREWEGLGDSIVKDDYGSVVLFRTKEDAELVRGNGEKALALVRWNKRSSMRTVL